MNKLLISLVAALALTAPAFAQDTMTGDASAETSGKTMKRHKKMDCVMMKNGKMMVTKNGKTAAMDCWRLAGNRSSGKTSPL